VRGEVLPIGGLKEKMLAAQRGGIKTVIIPEENRKDLADVPDEIKEGLKIEPVRWIDEVLEIALVATTATESGSMGGAVAGGEDKDDDKGESVRHQKSTESFAFFCILRRQNPIQLLPLVN